MREFMYAVDSISVLTLCVVAQWCRVMAHSTNSPNIAHAGTIKFGEGGVTVPIEELDRFIDPKNFISNYAIPSQPVKFKQAAQHFPAFKLWKSDEYFLSLEISPEDSFVSVEPLKKENRSAVTSDMHFQDFVKTYNSSNRYMVDALPDYLGDDVLVPWSLQCKDIVDSNIIDSVMWFSAGGTKSVVHSDSVDNINCLFSGNKSVVLVDPLKYWEEVPLDRPEGLYSAIDVDDVDLKKYPHLKTIEYYHVDITAGDCLFIPYRWIHQVRSFGRNIAVNIWWDHHNNEHIDLNKCETEEDVTLTMNNVDFIGFDAIANLPEQLRDQFKEFARARKGLRIEDLQYYFSPPAGVNFEELGLGSVLPLQNVIKLLDVDRNGKVILNEVLAASSEVWDAVSLEVEKFSALVHHALDAMEESSEESPDREEL